MFQSFGNSWRLFRATLDVLGRDKELILFPVLSGLASAAILAAFIGGMFGAGLLDPLISGARPDGGEIELVWSRDWPLAAGSFAYYFVNFFAMTYFTAALVGAAHIRLSGGDPTVASGLAAANRCLGAIFLYSLIAATVGLVLQMLESRARENAIGRFVVGLVGVAWTLATYLVVPVLVIERQGAIGSIQRSGTLLRQTWGEQLIANLGFGLIGFLFSLIGFGAIAVGVVVGAQFGEREAVFGLLIALGVAILYWVLLGIVLSALRGIFTAALYGHATHQTVRGFPVELLSGAFGARR
jgi:hypothetical protein